MKAYRSAAEWTHGVGTRRNKRRQMYEVVNEVRVSELVREQIRHVCDSEKHHAETYSHYFSRFRFCHHLKHTFNRLCHFGV